MESHSTSMAICSSRTPQLVRSYGFRLRTMAVRRANYFAGPTCDLWGADGTAFDNADNLYLTVNIQRKIVRLDTNGSIETLAAGPTAPLYAPTAHAFGTGRGDRQQ